MNTLIQKGLAMGFSTSCVKWSLEELSRRSFRDPGPAKALLERRAVIRSTPCSWVTKCNTASTHTEQHACNKHKDHHTEETGGRAGKTERPKTSRPPGALVSTRAPFQPRAGRVLSVTPPGPNKPAQLRRQGLYEGAKLDQLKRL